MKSEKVLRRSEKTSGRNSSWKAARRRLCGLLTRAVASPACRGDFWYASRECSAFRFGEHGLSGGQHGTLVSIPPACQVTACPFKTLPSRRCSRTWG